MAIWLIFHFEAFIPSLNDYSDTHYNLNFSRTVAGITKQCLVTKEAYLSYLLPKFEELVPTSLGSGAI